ncbi:MAG: 2-oxoacid:ferredoxin oxidoreductase subunit gamma [Lentisphaerae bacterium]|nr:2-oxoacid:ferredoxin oxidoreductase subunit gamma [Lentisphaerota bacterium]
MNRRIIIAGSGGQGVMLIGRMLAKTAMNVWNHITFFPAYGAEVRGGTSNCQIVLSSEEISSPLSEMFNCAIIMNQQSLERFLPKLTDNCKAIINGSLCEPNPDTRLNYIEATHVALRLGDKRAANFVLLGALLASEKLVDPAGIESEMQNTFTGNKKKAADLNIIAFREGMKLA